MWSQVHDPLHAIALSALVAAVPILFFLVGLLVLKLKGTVAGGISLILAALIAALVFHMPVGYVLGAALLGMLNAIWPIGFIVVMAVWLYRLAVRSGKFDVIRSSITGVSPDQRIQVLLIAFCFGAFLEGAAGFGVPIAICAALLVEVGFNPIKAAMLGLVANGAAGAYGAIGIPTLIGAQLTSIDPHALSIEMIVVLQALVFLVPVLMVFILDRWRGVRETWPAWLLVGVVFSGSQALILFTLGPALADVIPSVLALAALAALMRYWKPAHIYREPGAPEPEARSFTAGQVISAWAPFLYLTAAILIWSLPFVTALFAKGGALNWLVLPVHIPGLDQAVVPGADIGNTTPMSAVWSWTPLSATGTAILAAVLVTVLTTRTLTGTAVREEFAGAITQLWQPILLIMFVMGMAYIANYSGGSASIGLALAAVGAVFPLLSPLIGWFGVFITGSVVNNNNLFANLQSITASKIGVDPTLLVAANTAGGSIGKIVSPQSIAIATAATQQSGKESELMRASLPWSIGLLIVLCLWTLVLSLAA